MCHSDLHVRDGEWERPGPIVMGHEGAGIVEAVGDGIDPGVIGRPVALSWYAPCLRCRECQRGRQWVCTASPSMHHAQADGTTRLARPDGSPVLAYCSIGTMASAQVVPATAVVPMPEGVPPEVAALIGCGASTGVGAVLKTADVPAGSTVAIIGLGGVGLSCVMGAVIAGARRIVVVDINRDKIDLAGTLGATHWVLADPANPAQTVDGIREAAGDGGPDFVFEAIGLPVTIEQAIAALPPGGTAVLVGMTPFGRTVRFEASRSSTARAGSSAPTTGPRSRRSTSRATRSGSSRAACRSTGSSIAGSRSRTSTTRSTGSGPVRRRARSSCSRAPRNGAPGAVDGRPRVGVRALAERHLGGSQVEHAIRLGHVERPPGDGLGPLVANELDRAAADHDLVGDGGVLVRVEREPAVVAQLAELRGLVQHDGDEAIADEPDDHRVDPRQRVAADGREEPLVQRARRRRRRAVAASSGSAAANAPHDPRA